VELQSCGRAMSWITTPVPHSDTCAEMPPPLQEMVVPQLFFFVRATSFEEKAFFADLHVFEAGARMSSNGDAGAPSTNDVYIEHVSRAFAL